MYNDYLNDGFDDAIDEAVSDLGFAMQERESAQMELDQAQDVNSRQIAAHNEELDAYADFIASLDEDK